MAGDFLGRFFWALFQGTGKAHKLFQHKLFAPPPKPLFWAPRKKFMCLISWERTQKRGPTETFFWVGGGEDFWAKKEVPNVPFSATKSLVYYVFLPLFFHTKRWGERIGTKNPTTQKQKSAKNPSCQILTLIDERHRT